MTQEIEVTCYSGYRANETPLSFRYRDKEYHVEKVLERRVEESTQNRERIHYFRVLCRNREIFSIYYNAAEDRWGGVQCTQPMSLRRPHTRGVAVSRC
ncbi:MAG: hypothetical protein KAW12_24145, partial [Candidatus Aminicenantes bacterium]|nr:hypothetical protein [Candidatus Aminicenantes bacterium]